MVVAPVNLLFLGPPMAEYDLALWATEFVADYLPVWQELWAVVHDAEYVQDVNNPPTAINFPPLGTTQLLYAFYLSSWGGEANRGLSLIKHMTGPHGPTACRFWVAWRGVCGGRFGHFHGWKKLPLLPECHAGTYNCHGGLKDHVQHLM
ncbi:hypothetical protein [Pseudomonas chlororaphis]|uniref:hypothetical protein n=1 Tax=Pseudomonas chlororaphis TaxID=587753 RepID=UPI0012DA91C4|nr:hypothetical protein [Pseudomonas chlororaphis]